MRTRQILIGVLALGAAGLFVAFLPSSATRKPPPVLTVAGVEPADIYDDSGEMLLVTLRLQDPSYTNSAYGWLCLRRGPGALEARVHGRWVKLKDKLDWYGVGGRGESRKDLLLPSGADACRATLEYTERVRVFIKHPVKGRVLWLAERLPLFVRRRLPLNSWRWLGFEEYGPSPGWRRVSFELALAAAQRPGLTASQRE